jgi:hypothetical protein
MLARPYTNHHKRNNSWPPFRLDTLHQNQDINEDPFAFFISPSPDSEAAELLFDHMNADIDSEPRSRSLSPSMVHNQGKLIHSPAISKLKKWVEKMEIQYFHAKRSLRSRHGSLLTPPETPKSTLGVKRPPSPEQIEPIIEAVPLPVSPSHRGRRSNRSARRPYGNRMVRSHSKRARVWKEPGDDIWPVMEEQEDIGLGILAT